jgi:hypothetical protein
LDRFQEGIKIKKILYTTAATQPGCAADTAGAVHNLGRFRRQARGRLWRSGGSIRLDN